MTAFYKNELYEVARCASWGLAKGGDLDAWGDGKSALLSRLALIEVAEMFGIFINAEDEGIGRMYTRAEVEADVF